MPNERGPLTQREQDQLDSFGYHNPDPFQIENIATVRRTLKQAAHTLMLNVPDCADRTVAIRHLRDAMMSANAAIVLRGK